ncbi:hypothetical protein M407DRAFT_19786 [Tulasnella calospora MUT 4182]|uniref:Sodium/calcium exchanger membrane region domain-containing protein n=1 Tax=Tulasnella calospora MUT 4182 TaxID=1051891 RepID=A0A0C3LBA7_9AGAM|nr:hypothetical protein M407DRAFT_19786 [Tulasnella calospora MUT 4182]
MVKPPTNNEQAASLDEKQPRATSGEVADSSFNQGNVQSDPEKQAAAHNSFDIDLESGTKLGVPKSNTLHPNASSPAVIGGSHTDDETAAPPITSAPDSGTAVQDGAPRRRHKQHDTLQLPSGGGPRRAQSLPANPPPNPAGPVPALHPTIGQTLNKLLEPERKLAPPPNLRVSLYNIATYSWLNAMLVFVPVAWGMHFSHQTDTVIFVFSFLGIVPLAALLGFATEELALRVGQTLGGLLNATFGNAVELIIAILALTKGELRIVQASMLGSILSNCLLVLGMCFFAGGFRFHEQGYGIRAAQLNISLLSISVFSIVIPAAFSSSLHLNDSGSLDQEKTDRAVLAISRGTSIILLFVYAAYLVFQLWTHAYIYSPEASAYHSAQTHQVEGADGPTAPHGTRVFRVPHLPSLPSLPSIPMHRRSDTTTSSSSSSRSRRSSTSCSSSSTSSTASGPEEEHQKIKPIVALAMLVVVTVLTGLTAEFLVDSISGLTATGNISREFIALILLPLVGNSAEHFTAVTVSVKNKLDLAITVAVGSSIQIALFVIPFLVLLGWIIGQPLSLFFDIYETVVVFVSILVVNYAISDGKTNWLEGLVLMIIYVLIALTTWYYPGTNME